MARTTANGVELEYEIIGDGGEPLLLIMGLGAQMLMWPDGFCQLLAERGFQVIRYDNRDIGTSTKTQGPAPKPRSLLKAMITRSSKRATYTLADMADDAAGLLQALGIDQAHVVGASMGGMIAQQLTIDHPTRVRSLCSIMSNTGDASHGLSKPSLLLKARSLIFTAPVDDPEERLRRAMQLNRLISGPRFDAVEVERILRAEGARSDDTVGTARQMLAIAASPARNDGLRQVRVPTLVIHGMVDPLVLPSGGRETARCVPNSLLLMFPDMAHDLPRNRWPQIVEAIWDNAHRSTAAQPA